MLLLAAVAALAQLAGVSGNRSRPGTTLVFEGTHERWLVQAPKSSSARLEQAARSLGGGSARGPAAVEPRLELAARSGPVQHAGDLVEPLG